MKYVEYLKHELIIWKSQLEMLWGLRCLKDQEILDELKDCISVVRDIKSCIEFLELKNSRLRNKLKAKELKKRIEELRAKNEILLNT